MSQERRVAWCAITLFVATHWVIFLMCRDLSLTTAIEEAKNPRMGAIVLFIIVDICFLIIAVTSWANDVDNNRKTRRRKIKKQRTRNQRWQRFRPRDEL